MEKTHNDAENIPDLPCTKLLSFATCTNTTTDRIRKMGEGR
jgi:hypothetical protein